jgi:hypothetical protein
MWITRRYKLIAGAIGVVAVAIICWVLIQRYQHRILIVFPEGTAAPNASVTLDYDPVYWDYHPTSITGDAQGVAFIPPKQAHGNGWEVMRINATRDNRRYHASRNPSECRYPMKVILAELPQSRQSTTIEQAVELWDVLKHAFSP